MAFMAIRRQRIEYTVYPPHFDRDRDRFRDFRTVARARRFAISLGVGAQIYRTINQVDKGVAIDKFWDEWVVEWAGTHFKDITSNAKGLMKFSDWSN